MSSATNPSSAPAPSGPVATAPPGGRRRERPTSSTPERLQRLTALVGVASVAFAALAFLGLGRTADRAERLRDLTGPVLVAAQDVRASLAEANAAQSTAYLALPTEDLTSLRSYRDALDRATAQLAEVAARTDGDDALLDAVQDVGSEVTRFAGLVEAARATRGLATPDGAAGDEAADGAAALTAVAAEGDALLVAAQAQLAGPVDAAVERMVERADQDLDTGLDLLTLAVIGLGVLVVALVVLASVRLAGLTRRVLNPGLVVAAVALVTGVVWLVTSTVTAQARLDDATGDGYATIQLTAQLQQGAFGEQARAVAATVAPDADLAALGQPVADGVLDDGVAAIGQRADGAREAALADELALRHGRWQEALAAARSSEQPLVAQAATAEPFRGFVFALDGVVADNRDQFLAGLDDAAAPLGLLPLALLVLGLAAGGAGVLGIRPRLQEYR